MLLSRPSCVASCVGVAMVAIVVLTGSVANAQLCYAEAAVIDYARTYRVGRVWIPS
jgi:hypothetical protein